MRVVQRRVIWYDVIVINGKGSEQYCRWVGGLEEETSFKKGDQSQGELASKVGVCHAHVDGPSGSCRRCKSAPPGWRLQQVRAVSTRVRVGLDSGTLDPHSRASRLNSPARLNWLILTHLVHAVQQNTAALLA